MTPKISLATAIAALALVPTAGANHQYGDALYQSPQATARVSPDLADRASTAAQARVSNMLDAREQSLGARVGNGKAGALEARERSFAAKQDAQLVSARYPDWFERAAAAAIRDNRVPVVDDRFRIDPKSVPVPVSVTSSGRELEWPQIGIGFGLGILLPLGLFFGLRLVHTRLLAH